MKLKNCFDQGIHWAGIFFICTTLSCSDSSENASTNQSSLFIELVDAPAVYDEFNIVISRISIHRAGASADVGWSIVSSNPVGPINVLSLQSGTSAVLVNNTVPTGSYDKIKLYFGARSVVENGVGHLVMYDTANGYTLNFTFDIFEKEQTQLTLDFDVYGSISKIGNSYYLAPSMRAVNTSLSGWIIGAILDSAANKGIPAIITTSTALETVSARNDTITGVFRLSALPENMYSLHIAPNDTAHYTPVIIDSVRVSRREIRNLGIIYLPHR